MALINGATASAMTGDGTGLAGAAGRVAGATAEAPDTTARVVLGLALGLSGLLVAVCGWLGATGRLRRNRLVGIRTRRSMADDRAWRTVHRVAAPWLYAAGAALVAGGQGAAFFSGGTGFAVTTSVFVALCLAFVLLAAWRGHRALDQQQGRDRAAGRAER